MANTWGSLKWGEGNFGEQGNITVPVTGIGGNPIAWGDSSFGSTSFGGESNSIPLNLSEETVTGEVNAGWGRLTWGENAWGIAGDVLVEGVGLNIGLGVGTVTAGADIDVNGQQQNLSIGDPNIIIATEVFLSENPLPNLTIAKGTVDAAPDAEVTGNQLNTGLGSLTVYNEQGWGRDRWGTEVWGAQGIWVSVQLDNTNLGLGVTSGVQETWGQDEWGATTTEWGGNSITDVDILTIASPTGQELTAAEGTVDPSPDATVVGIGLSASVAVGSVVEADATVVITNAPSTEFEAQGNAALSTDQAKFGVSSLELDGTDDSVDSTSNIDLSSSNFTIDVWIRPNNVSGYKGIWQSGTSTTMQSYLLGNAVYWTVAPSTIITTAVTVNANEWTMLSYERQGNTHRIYKNGTLADTATTANKQDNGPFTIGKNGFGDFNGYIDEFRVSNIARYGGSSFTEPTSEFSVDANTLALLHFDGADGSTDMVNAVPLPTALGTNQGQAELEAVTIANITGQALEVGLRNAVAGASALVLPTGSQANIALGNEVSQVWRFVDTGTTVSYTEVSTGTSVTWNDIDTAA